MQAIMLFLCTSIPHTRSMITSIETNHPSYGEKLEAGAKTRIGLIYHECFP
ncbi:hypothetical protein ACFVSS_23695 [Peribacillus butanolivorans]|uniref:hypothetical protein n=1 Tax=Peribacillus butanolivorans TaxID=421767 RepID=UPI0036732D9B